MSLLISRKVEWRLKYLPLPRHLPRAMETVRRTRCDQVQWSPCLRLQPRRCSNWMHLTGIHDRWRLYRGRRYGDKSTLSHDSVTTLFQMSHWTEADTDTSRSDSTEPVVQSFCDGLHTVSSSSSSSSASNNDLREYVRGSDSVTNQREYDDVSLQRPLIN